MERAYTYYRFCSLTRSYSISLSLRCRRLITSIDKNETDSPDRIPKLRVSATRRRAVIKPAERFNSLEIHRKISLPLPPMARARTDLRRNHKNVDDRGVRNFVMNVSQMFPERVGIIPGLFRTTIVRASSITIFVRLYTV